MGRAAALLPVMVFALLGFESVYGGSQVGSCRLVCDPFQSQSGTHDLGANGLVIPLASSGGGPPGPAGPPGKAGPPGPQGPKGEGSTPRGAVAFYAALREDFGKDDVLKFSNVVTNLGSRYDSSTGIFTCQSAGVYHFSYHILKTGTSLKADLVLNDKTVASAVAVDALHADTASNSAVLQLSAGDRVFVRLNKSDRTLKDTNNIFSTFSGHLLYEL
ncbi:complement C1q-like protein 4 [Astyanax mexicanus]|uniref:Complement C1q-like protein 4 n=2 Tax=Astyanax mexicanus TaxID=7994 RepID=A0A8B9KPA6_ASTMX|nr:complement C1q-like protein 4 [Astyanax mexicanus]KAG9282791.1 complement C1q-like protein 4 [Astyanax mexicanus]